MFLNLGNGVPVLFLTINVWIFGPENINIELFYWVYKEIIALKEKK